MPIHTLGPFRLNTQHDLLLRESAPVALGRRAIALLRTLVERPGILVSKDALIEAAWSGRLVEESNLPVQIAALRRVLGEAPGGDCWIETMPGRGYRFIGPIVTEMEKGAMAAPPQVDTAQEPAPTPRADAERRQITAMSCELIGLSGRADGVGLEDLRDVVGAFQRCVSETVDRHEGLVVSRLGNAALVLFGYPATHEYDAERAVRAGLELCTAVRALRSGADLPMRCRVGIATGMAIIGDISGDGALQDREIIGDAPNLAGRLHLSAQPDIVVIEPATRRLIGNLFDCRDLGTIDTTSGAEPLRIWQVLEDSGAANRFEALRGLALSPLVGRDEEIDILLRRWASAKAGDGQVVLVSGDPGLGKSRLVAALEERVHAEPHLRLRYFCSPYHQDSALYPFVEQLGREAGFARNDMPAAKLERLEVLLARAALPHEDVAILADLMSLPASERHPLPNLSPQRKKERTLEALIRQLEGLARQQPVLMVFEDAHWIDPTSRELLDLTVERVRRLPVLLIVTFRPEFETHWIGQPRVTMLALNRLDRRDRVSLMAQIAGKTLPEIVIEQIADRTDGVPLFVEELTKSVLESGLLREETERYVLDGTLPPFTIPTTLYASLLARLDRPGSVRLVAQTGAAIGREFPYALLRAVSDLPEDELQTGLAGLAASELVFQRGTPPEAVYSFKHALVQDAAHGSLLRNARARCTHASPKRSKAIPRSSMDSQPEILAQHYARGRARRESRALLGQGGTAVTGTLGAGRSRGPAHPGPRSDRDPARHGGAASRADQASGRADHPTHARQRLRRRRTQGGCGAGTLVDRASRSAGRASRRPVAAVLRPLRLLGNELYGIQWRCLPRSRGAVPGARGKAKGDSPAHGRASHHGNFLSARGGHRGRPRTLGSSDRALRSCRASSAGDAIWPRRCGGNLVLPIVGFVATWLSRGRAQRRRRRAQEYARDRSSRHADVRVILCLDTVYPLRQPCRGSRARPRACRSGRRERFAVLAGVRNDEPRLRTGPDRQGFGRDRNVDLWDCCPADNGSDTLLATLFAALGARPCGAWAIRGGLALHRRSDDSGGNNQRKVVRAGDPPNGRRNRADVARARRGESAGAFRESHRHCSRAEGKVLGTARGDEPGPAPPRPGPPRRSPQSPRAGLLLVYRGF